MKVKLHGYNGVEYEIDHDYFIADYEGRGGKVVWVRFDPELDEHIIGAVPSSGPTYELRESMISFVAPPDEEVA